VLAAGDPLLVGAAALRLGVPGLPINTRDLDLCVSLDQATIVAKMKALPGWERSREEHRWLRRSVAPIERRPGQPPVPVREGQPAMVDLLPATEEAIAAGRIEWATDNIMSLAGVRTAWATAVEMEPVAGIRLAVATPPAVALLKLVTLSEVRLLRRGGRDIDHLCWLLDRWEADSERCFSDEFLDSGLDYDLAPAWLLGRDIRAIAVPEESAVVRAAAEWMGEPDSTQLVLAASKGPPSWQGELDEVRRRLDAFVDGLRSPAGSSGEG
jgi:predicted nucleotidyltransferase